MSTATVRALLLAALLTGAGAAGASADVATVPAAADNTLFDDPAGSLSNGAGEHFFVGCNSTPIRRRGLVRFDVAAALPEGATITSVQLTLNMSRSAGGEDEWVRLHRVLAAWGEGSSDASGSEGNGAPATPGSATWLHAFYDGVLWGSPGGDFDPAPSAAALVGIAEGPYAWSSPSLVADVQSWLDDPAGNFGWVLIGNEDAASTAKRFDTRESPIEAFRPALTVQYIPAPPTAAAVAALALAPRRRRAPRADV